ncbi:acetate/propionate family kinase [Hyphomicrobium sp. DY-1]|uniref:acetate/propionate family kinase n=1 Tax=Hyphomicrobium sp. DY-1 TaxID=3075650 RepID=UPI0039C27EAA
MEAATAKDSNILVINAGSSSIKFAIYTVDLALRLHGELDGIGTHPRLVASDADGTSLVDRRPPTQDRNDVHNLLSQLMSWLEEHLGSEKLGAIGHRVAIGGLEHTGPVVVTPAILEKLRSFVPLAPLHQPRNLEPLEILKRLHPHLPQVACFDTAFHRTMPRVAELYGLPRSLSEAGAHRYGFHGLSYEYISGSLANFDRRAAEGRTVIAHLGSGASMCAVRGGRSIATTMGFSPLSGLVMGTRSGDLDPGLMIWLLRERGMTVEQVEQMLYRESGMKGVSGLSGDMRDLLSSKEPQAREAVDLFVYRVSSELGSLCAALEGLDAVVFTAGIGEHAAEVRELVCKRSGWLGIQVDDDANRKNASRISTVDSEVSVWVIPTNEELIVAKHTAGLVLSLSWQGGDLEPAPGMIGRLLKHPRT